MEKIEERLKLRVKKLRNEAGLSQVALATRAGVSIQTIKDIEAGRRGLGLKALEGISSALNVSIEDLKGEKEPLVKPVIQFRVSKLTKMLDAIPDEVYDMAQNFNSEDEVWESVMVIMRDRKKELDREKAKKNHA